MSEPTIEELSSGEHWLAEYDGCDNQLYVSSAAYCAATTTMRAVLREMDEAEPSGRDVYSDRLQREIEALRRLRERIRRAVS